MNLRRLLLVAALAFATFPLVSGISATPASATHFRANQISWHRTAPTTAEFHVTGSWRLSAFFSGTPSLGAQFFPTSISTGDGSFVRPPFHVTSHDTANDVVSGEAHFSHAYASTGPFVANLSSCCRLSPPLHRNNGDGDVNLDSVVNLAATSASAVSQISPIVDCGINALCQFFVPADDADNQPMRWRLAQGSEAGSGFVQPSGASVDPTTGLYSWNTSGASLNSSGDSFFSTQVIVENLDSAGQIVATTPVDFFIRVTNSPNQAPVFDPPTPADGSLLSIEQGDTATFSVAASDPDASDTVTLGILGLPSDATFTPTSGNPATGTFSWTPTAPGRQILTLIAQDQLGRGALQRSVTIGVKNDPPEFVSPTPAEGSILSGHRGDLLSAPLLAVDPNQEPVTYAVHSGPPDAGIELVNGDAFLEWVPDVLGDTSITVRATDPNGGFDERTFVARTTNRPPAFSEGTPANGASFSLQATGTITLSVSAADPDLGDTVALGTLGLPPGATYQYVSLPGQSSSATFTWTPAVAGTTQVVFTVHDASGAADTYRTVTITVTKAATRMEVNPSILQVSTAPVTVGPGGVVNNDVYVLFASAYLRAAPNSPTPNLALYGYKVRFFAGSTFLCEGTTRSDGMAFCQGELAQRHLETVLAQGYQAKFAGDATYKAVTGSGSIVRG